MAKRATAAGPHPISLAELARRSGKNRSTITRQAQGSLRAAMLADGRIDAAHEAVAAWARGHGIAPRSLTAGDVIADSAPRPRPDPKPKTGARRRARSDELPPELPDLPDPEHVDPTDELPELDAATIVRVKDMTLGYIAEHFKTQTRFKGVLQNVELAEKIRYKFLDNEEQEGRLIPRDFVLSRVFGGWDEIFRKFLGDLPKTVTAQLYAFAKANEGTEKGEALVHDSISVQIKAAKERMLHELGAGAGT